MLRMLFIPLICTMLYFHVQAAVIANLADDYIAGTKFGDTTESVGLLADKGKWTYFSASSTDPATWTSLMLQWGRVLGGTRYNPGYVASPVNAGTGIGADNAGISSMPLFSGEPDTPNGFLYFHTHNSVGFGTVAQWTAGPVDLVNPRLLIDLKFRKTDTKSPVTLLAYHNNALVYSYNSLVSTSSVTAAFVLKSYAEGDTISLVLENAGSSANDGTFLSARISSIPEPHVTVPSLFLSGELGRRRDIQKSYLWRYQAGNLRGNKGFLNFETDLIGYFTNRLPRATAGEVVLSSYAGVGKAIDAAVWYSRTTGDNSLISEKDHWVNLIINSQDDNGYFGFIRTEDNAVWYFSGWIIHDGAYACIALLDNYKLFDHTPSLVAAKRFIDFVMERWKSGTGCSPIGITEALLYLYELTGELSYLDDFANIAFDGRFIDEEAVSVWKQYLYPPDSTIEPATKTKVHTYRYFARCIDQLDLDKLRPNSELEVMTDYVTGKMTDRRRPGMFISGATGRAESWVEDQDGRGGIGEACAVVHQIWMLSRLIEQHGDLTYGNLMERMILNHMCAAQNADVTDGRSRYFTAISGARSYNKGAHCCEGNTRRFWARLPEQVLYVQTNSIAVNLYAPFEAKVMMQEKDIHIKQETEYPCNGSILIQINPSSPIGFNLDLRVPAWASTNIVSVNDSPISIAAIEGGMRISRVWNSNDVVKLTFPMKWRWVKGHGYYKGRYALMRGPQVFCVSRDYNPTLNGVPLSEIVLDPDSFTSADLPMVTSNRNGQAVRVNGHLPDGATVSVLFTDFPEENGEETYFPLSDTSETVEDELYHTVDLYPQLEVIERQENPPLSGHDDFSGGNNGTSLDGVAVPGSELAWTVGASGCEFNGSGGVISVDDRSTMHAHVTFGNVHSRVWIETEFSPCDSSAFTAAGRIALGMGNGYNCEYWSEEGRDTLTVCMGPLTGGICLKMFDFESQSTRISEWKDYGTFDPVVNTPQQYRLRLDYDPNMNQLYTVLSNKTTGTSLSNTLDTTGMNFTLNTFGFEMTGLQAALGKPYIDSFYIHQLGTSRTLDADNDGIPSAWEEANGLYRDLNDAEEDPDADGFSNFSEYIAGTNPLDKQSRFEIRKLQIIPTGLRLSWFGGTDVVQIVEYLPNDGARNSKWTNLLTRSSFPSFLQTAEIPLPATTGWFRIRAMR